MASTLEIKSLQCGYLKQALTPPMSFHMNLGDLIIITGQNGTGKTTLLKTIIGLIPPITGQIFFNGKMLTQAKKKKPNWGYLGVNDKGFFPHLSMEENLIFWALGNLENPKDIDQAIYEWKSQFPHLQKTWSIKFHQASFGTKRIYLALKTFLNHPQFLFLDEPFSGLDENNRQIIIQLAKKGLQEKKTSILLSTPEIEDEINQIKPEFKEIKLEGSRVIKI